MVAEDTTVYLVNGSVLGLCAVLLAGVALRKSKSARTVALVAVVPAVSMAIAYLLMSLEVATYETAGREQSIVRFIGYTFALASIGYVLKETVHLSNYRGTLLTTVLVFVPWVTFVSWFFTGIVESLITALSLGIFVFAGYLLYGPISRQAADVGGERQLLYAKLRNLFVLCYGTLILTSAASEQVLGLLTAFVSTVAAGYADAVLMVGTGLLVLSAVSIFDTSADPERSTNAGGAEGETRTATDNDASGVGGTSNGVEASG